MPDKEVNLDNLDSTEENNMSDKEVKLGNADSVVANLTVTDTFILNGWIVTIVE